MPPACRFTREQIVAAALAITRERGFDAVTARAVADTLHSSSKVIFSAFSGMDDLLAATIENVYLWAAVLAVLGNARHYLHQETAVSRFFTQRSYALYVVHYPVLLLTASLLTERTTLPAALMYLLTLVIDFGATLGLSEIIRRIPGIRYLTLGIRKEKKA